MSSEGME